MAKRKNVVLDNEVGDDDELLVLNDAYELTNEKKRIQSLLPKDIKIIAKNESQKKLINSIKNNEITICAGLAGCGKTYVAVAYALSLIRKSSNRYRRIYFVKSVTTLRDEELGFLKGDLNEKIQPSMWSFFINTEKLILKRVIVDMVKEEIIKSFPLAYMRGVSLDDSIIIVDEAQNIGTDNMRTMMTRVGMNSKLIILGDTNQIDMKYKQDSSLDLIMKMFEDVDSFGVIRMDETDTNIRNPLINTIESKFKEFYDSVGQKSDKTRKLIYENGRKNEQ
jgi:phosphate starvation-inducible protein PhoH and related proteins